MRGVVRHIEPSSESGVLQNIDGIPLRSAKYMVSPRARQERVAVFIDGANLYAASRALGFDVDYKNLLAYFRQQAYLVRAYYYTYLLIPGLGLSSLGGIDEVLDVTAEFLIQARDGSSS
jgi:hypothetical protein